jgi:hypothetical protein
VNKADRRGHVPAAAAIASGCEGGGDACLKRLHESSQDVNVAIKHWRDASVPGDPVCSPGSTDAAVVAPAARCYGEVLVELQIDRRSKEEGHPHSKHSRELRRRP